MKSVSRLCGLLLALENLLVVRVAGFCLCFSERQVMGWMKNSILKKEEKKKHFYFPFWSGLNCKLIILMRGDFRGLSVKT